MARIFQKKIIEPGTYEGEKVSAERVRHWAKEAQKMLDLGLLIPCPYYHDKKSKPIRNPDASDANTKNNAGFWRKFWVDDKDVLWSEIHANDDESAGKIGKAARQCSLAAAPEWNEGGKVWKDAITHIALTNKAKAPTGDEFVPVVAMSEETPFMVFSLEMLTNSQEFDHESSDSQESGMPEKDPGEGGSDGGSGLDSLIKLLREHDIELTDDTDETNFVDHLTSALTALNKKKKEEEGQDLTERPQGSKAQRPSPIAMAQEISEFAVELLSGMASHALSTRSISWSFWVPSLLNLTVKPSSMA